MPRPRKDHVPLSVEIPRPLAAALDRAKKKRKRTKAAIVADALVRELGPAPPLKSPARTLPV